jgi:O-antigen/teichoic acid export membrane protein
MEVGTFRVDRARITRSFVWATSGATFQLLGQIAALAVLARLLRPYEFGIVSVAVLTTQVSQVFCEFGVAPAVVQASKADDAFLGTAFRMSCAFGALVAGALWMIAPVISRALHVQELIWVLRLYTIVFLIKGWSSVQEAMLTRELRFRYLATSDAWSFAIGYFGISVTCAAAGFSYWSIVLGHIGQATIRAIALGMAYPAIGTKPMDKASCWRILRYGAGQTLSRLGSLFGAQVDSYVVAGNLGIAAVGLYGRANQLASVPPAQIGQIFDNVVFPAVSRMQSQISHVAAAYKLSLTGMLLLSVPAATFLVGFRAQIICALLGRDWMSIATPLGILALALPFRLIHKVSDPTARALGATYARAWRQWLFATALLLLSIGLSSYSLSGISWAVVVASMLDAGLMGWLCSQLTELSPRDLAHAVVPGVRLGVITLIALTPLMRISPQTSLANLGIVALGGLLLLIIAGLACFKFPALALGAHGETTLRILFGLDDVSKLRLQSRGMPPHTSQP